MIAKPEKKGNKIYIFHQLPENWRRRLHPSIGFTYWETSKIHDNWVRMANQMNAVFLSSLHNIEIFRNAGVKVPLFHIRPSLSHVSSSSEQPPKYLRKLPPFRFLSVSQWVERKGFDILLKAFWEEFTADDNVALVIKTFDLDAQDVERIKIKHGVSAQSAPVYFDLEPRNDNEMDALYRNCQAFVLPSRGEGLGYPLLEAAARGLPVITTGWGGQLDFLQEHTSYLIPYQLVPVKPQSYYGYQSDQLWAEVSVPELRNIMRSVFENYE
ncbi:MAG: glycosyl transferase family 2 protein, partial [Paenibacillus sp. RIFOXYA1_FULL_44_5]